ncbi:MAG: 4-phosphoerythronate dehydrogenase [Spirochaetes bacterium]|nr:4-phosphoerythronate dehydrogenase [Spirochaetota bacterium]
MKIIADENIPMVKKVFDHVGEVKLVSGRDMNNNIIKDAEILLVRSITKVDEKLLNNSNIKFAATATIGEDHIDKEYLKSRNIGFSSAPGSNAQSVAEYVFTALFELSKKYKFNLREKSIGIIGVGNVGSRVKKIAETLNMNILLNDPPKKRETGDPLFIDLETLLAGSDIVTVHVPLNKTGCDATFQLINEKFLSLMKNNSILINSSRGKVMEENAIIKNRKKLSGLILDVWANEPDINIDLLKAADIATPHIAGYSYDGKINGTKMIYEACCKHFGIESNWNIDISDNSLVMNLKKSKELLYDAFTQAYPVLRDNDNLKKITEKTKEERGRYFDKLRKEYPVRREFKNYRIECDMEKREEVEILKKLGFII